VQSVNESEKFKSKIILNIEVGLAFEDESHNVLEYGLMHLCEYGDKTEEEEEEIRAKEDACLSFLDSH
jgi:ssRNA-specific RNase YbeY (16S rRNA maturation enzyme)